MKICIVGLGNMGQSIYDALERGGFEVVGCDKEDDLSEKVIGADAVVIAVKPQSFESIGSGADLSGKLVISIMAGVSVEKIIKVLGSKKIVRVMPNLPLQVGAAFSGWYASDDVLNEEKDAIVDILMSFGTEVEVDNEDDIDKITALSGSGPAYYYYMNRALRMKAMDMGLSEEQARKIARGTFLGAAKLLEEGEDCSGKLISKISSRGGTTEAAVKHL
ncbi:pyrroline-5-carboxylate reductase, partial [Candidatus Peregrinibacteria bacterium]|nr:pyrroline-5-carboxylate reductase [Candidatus Peregrinibacteria bacterium]